MCTATMTATAKVAGSGGRRESKKTRKKSFLIAARQKGEQKTAERYKNEEMFQFENKNND